MTNSLKQKNPVRSNELGLDLENSNKLDNTTLFVQRQRLLNRLQKAPASTLQLRHEENILAPAARIFELRHCLNYNIMTVWTIDYDTAGRKHRVAKYALHSGKWGDKNQELGERV